MFEKLRNVNLKSRPTVIASVFAGMFLTGCGGDEEKIAEVIRPVKTLEITESLKFDQRQYPAQVSASKKVNLSFQVAGQIITFPVKQGEKVEKGQILARLDSTDYRSEHERAMAVAREAMKDFERIAKLYKKGVSSKAELDVKQKEYEVAVADAKIAEKALKDTVLRAPFDAVVGKTFADNFEDIQAKDPVLSLNDITNLDIEVDVPEEVMSHMKEYQEGRSKAEVEFATMPGKRYKVVKKEFATEADPETLTYHVVLTMKAPEEITVLPGMTATVHHTVELKSKSTYLLPTTAVIGDNSGEKTKVWVFDKDTSTVKKRDVEVKTLQGKGVVVTKGLNLGDYVVTAGVHYLVEGQKVKLLAE